jgi:hypothetical protein
MSLDNFDTKSAGICTIYQTAPTAAEQGVQTVSIDEMTGIRPWNVPPRACR